jgi:hypothetical protein
VEHREAELREVAPRDESADDPAGFLRDLRQLRDEARLGHAELAARAHYPCEAIREAEAGPALPDLPVLSAYVRSCGGAVAEWEERWRTLTRSPALPLLSARTAGCSDAATAGARIGSVSLAADGHDPALVMAALSRVANGITAEPSPRSTSPGVPAAPLAPAASLVPAASGAAAAAAAAEAPPARDAAVPEPGSLFSPADQAAAPAADPVSLVTSVPEVSSAALAASVAGTDHVSDVSPVPAVNAVRGAVQVPGGDPVPSARLAPWESAAPMRAAARPQAPTAASAVPVPGRAAGPRSGLPSKPLIAAIAILVCLIAGSVLLFA